VTAVEVGGWGDPGADPPHEWEHTRTRLEEAECALAGMVHENNELRAIIRRVREYANLNRAHATGLRDVGRRYDALPYSNTADVLERIIGDRPDHRVPGVPSPRARLGVLGASAATRRHH